MQYLFRWSDTKNEFHTVIAMSVYRMSISWLPVMFLNPQKKAVKFVNFILHYWYASLFQLLTVLTNILTTKRN